MTYRDSIHYLRRVIAHLEKKEAEEAAAQTDAEAMAEKNDPIVSTVLHLTETSGVWKGSITQLRDECVLFTGNNKLADIAPNHFSRHCHKLQRIFRTLGIYYNPPTHAVHGQRLHVFKRMSRA